MTDLPDNISPDVKDLNPEVFPSQDALGHKNKGVEKQEMITSTTLPESEASFQKKMIELLHLYGWRVCEFRKARIRKQGVDVYRTPFGADGSGFPDLLAVRGARLIAIENKSKKGKLSPEQRIWQDLLLHCIEYYIFRPSDCWQEIVEIVK